MTSWVAVGACHAYNLASLNEPHAGTDAAELIDVIGGIDMGYAAWTTA
jgi:hypothetical protein